MATPDKTATLYAGTHIIARYGEELSVHVYWSDDFGDPEAPTIGWAYGDGAEAEGGFRTAKAALLAYLEFD